MAGDGHDRWNGGTGEQVRERGRGGDLTKKTPKRPMDQISLVIPVRPGRTTDTRDFMREVEPAAMPAASARSLYQRCGSGLFPCIALR